MSNFKMRLKVKPWVYKAIEMYEKGKSQGEIAKEFNIDQQRVSKAFKMAGYKSREQNEGLKLDNEKRKLVTKYI